MMRGKSFISRFRRFIWLTGLGLAGVFILFIILDACFPLKVNIRYSQVIEASDGTMLHAYLSDDGQWRMKTEPGDISQQLKKAILFKEDRYFYVHPGINPFSVVRAFFNNLIHHRRTSGASTITMQVARLLDPVPRTYGNKLLEMFHALQLEFHYSKSRILHMYFDLVPYGSNIDGLKAAAELYFNEPPSRLSLAELTALSVIPNRPNSLSPGRDNGLLVKERNKWLHRFGKAGVFPEDIIRDALAEPLRAYRHDIPTLAPQFCLRMHHQFSELPVVKTALNLRIQQRAELLTKNFMSRLELRGIHNAAVMIINNRTHAVSGYIGSQDFGDSQDGGQVDGVMAVRSPGSALKPLLYGMAFDLGLATPKSVITDVPVNFSGYAPENYDRHFNGNVTIEYALENSLNIPAVKTLDKVGVGSFISRLSLAGFSEIHADSRKLGLSMILGGCGVRLDEVTHLYAALADYGKQFPLTWLKPAKEIQAKQKKRLMHPVSAKRLISPAAAFMVTDILSKLGRPDLPGNFIGTRGLPKIAWKTGTSYGRRDAWSIGYNKDYTVGVWAGNFSGIGIADLSGATVATPLMFDIFNAIDHYSSGDWYSPPSTVSFRLVCAVSGKVPNVFCDQQVMDYYIPGVSSNEVCDHLKKVWISSDGKISYCTSCLPANGYITRWYPNISPELAAYYDSQHIPYEKIPPHNPACSRVFGGRSPIITSLNDGMSYYVEKKEAQQLMLGCTAANDVKTVYWYVNNRFLCKCPVTRKMFFTPENAHIKISCTDDKGRNTDIHINVHFI